MFSQRLGVVSRHLLDVRVQSALIDGDFQGVGHGIRKAYHAFVAHGGSFSQNLPAAVVPGFEGEVFHSLSFGDVFLQHHHVDRALAFYGIGACSSLRSFPRLVSTEHFVVFERFLAVSGKFFQTGHIGFMNPSPTVGRNVQQEDRVVAYRLEIDVRQLLQTFYLVIFSFMPEPSRTDGYIDFRRIPEEFRGIFQHFAAA